jgi:hypothetical protein
MVTRVTVVIQPTGHGYVVQVPALPGINAQGETEALAREQARLLVKERLRQVPPDIAARPGRLEFIDL